MNGGSPEKRRCEACGSGKVAAAHSATERMYGMGGSFVYQECACCGTLTSADAPDDLSPYYPRGYYSLAMPQDSGTRGPAQRLLRGLATRATLANPTLAGVAAAGARRVGRSLPAWTALLAGLRLHFDAAVLDVGCGDGHRLRSLRDHGFGNLTGSDPYLPAACGEGGIRLTPEPLHQLAGTFDVIMFHHSLEHVRDPMAALASARGLLGREGCVLVRLPLAGAAAWRTYGTEWVQLDAPRHLFLPTAGGLHLLAARAGFSVARTIYDSDGFQFWGSELYRRGIPLRAGGTQPSPEGFFTAEELRHFDRRAAELNARGDGDQAAFLLRPTLAAA